MFKSFIIIILTVFTGLPLAAQQPLTLQQAISLGLENSEQLKTSQSKSEVYHYKVTQIQNQLIPALTVSAAYNRLSNNVEPYRVSFPTGTVALNPQILNQYTNRISLQQIVFTGFRTNATIEQVKLLERAAQLDVNKDRNEIVNNITNAYYNYYKALESKKIVEENMTTAKARLEDMRNLKTQGLALENDTLKASLALSSLETSMMEVDNMIAVANFNLALMLDLPTETLITLDETSLFPMHPGAAKEEYIATALQNRSELKAQMARKMAAEKAVTISKGSYYPTVSAGINYDINRPNQRVFPQQDAFKNTWTAGVSLNYNLTNLYSNKAMVGEALANKQQSDIAIEQLTESIKMEVNANALAYTTAIKRIELSQKSLVQAVENQRISKNRYDAGLITFSDLQDADALVLQNEINILNARTDAELAWQKLMKSTGNNN